jgi:hypothetical protein
MRLLKVLAALDLNKLSLPLWVFTISLLKPMEQKAEEPLKVLLHTQEEEVP